MTIAGAVSLDAMSYVYWSLQDRQRAAFITGDACSLPLDIGLFGCVLAANLIDRLHSPTDFLGRLASLVAPGGVLVITSPYTFLREYTPRVCLVAYMHHPQAACNRSACQGFWPKFSNFTDKLPLIFTLQYCTVIFSSSGLGRGELIKCRCVRRPSVNNSLKTYLLQFFTDLHSDNFYS